MNMRKYVYWKDIESKLPKECIKLKLPIVVGQTSEGKMLYKDLVRVGNILISGATGSGKSVFIDSFISTLLLLKSPQEVNIIIINPKRGLMMTEYNNISHILFPVVSDMDVASRTLTWCLDEMDRRLKELNINPANEKGNIMPYIVILVDEFADLMLYGDDMPLKLQKLVEIGCSVGIHTILSTSSPRDTILTKELREAIPGRIVGALASREESKMVLDQYGAEELLGNGDMLYKNMNSQEVLRVQTPFISYAEVQEILKDLTTEDEKVLPPLELEDSKSEGLLLEKAQKLIEKRENLSIEYLQKELKIGYITAKKLFRQLKEEK